jgi:anti-anti-sigma factor
MPITIGGSVLDDGPATPLSSTCSARAEQHLDTRVMRLYGEFDLASEDGFRRELDEVLSGIPATFLLDLRGLDFMDSTGLRMLIAVDARSRDDGFDFAVLCGDGHVRRVLHETGLDGVLPVVDARGEEVPATDSPI